MLQIGTQMPMGTDLVGLVLFHFRCVEQRHPHGYAAVDLDCDDTDEDVFPGKIEVCDEKDNDCNNVVDENVQLTFYVDSDEDGFGNILTSTQSCIAPVGYVENPNDCDDDDNNQHPNADEICNLEDDNCDDNVDEDSSVDAQVWYNDADGDGFGSMTDSTVSCYAPSNYLSNNEDCNDNNIDQNQIQMRFVMGKTMIVMKR